MIKNTKPPTPTTLKVSSSIDRDFAEAELSELGEALELDAAAELEGEAPALLAELEELLMEPTPSEEPESTEPEPEFRLEPELLLSSSSSKSSSASLWLIPNNY